MAGQLIAEKIESLRRCVQRVEDKCPEGIEILASDPDLQDIISLNLTRAVQLSVHIIAESNSPPPDTMGATFDTLSDNLIIDQALAIRMKRAVGFRNVAIHNYREIDWVIVYRICQDNLKDFKEYARALSQQI